jgi:NADH-quinone oxidoreductase subunit L
MESIFSPLSALPFALLLLSALCGMFLAKRLQRGVARMSMLFSVAAFAAALAALAINPGQPQLIALPGVPWASLYLDSLSCIMTVLVSGIGLVVHLYSARYMAEEPGYTRFYVLLDLLTASVLLMVAAGDLVMLLIAWQLVGVVLYFMLCQDTVRPAAQRFAFWSLFTYRLGDLPLVLATVLLYQAYGTHSLPALFAQIAAAPAAHSVLGLPLPEVVGMLIVLAAFARSAQFPLHTWLPYTMEGPTPVSALMHAGIVNAGGFLMNRFAPIFVHTQNVLHVVFVVGLITAVLGSLLMLTQNDIKKSLGYSTMGQMGFMFVECGVGAFSLAVYHLIAHGLFKGTMFLGAGGVIGDARKHDGVPHDDVYTFVVERKPVPSRLPWVVAAVITVIVPLVILALSHWVVAGDFVGQQGAVILLFFGWVTGAQLLFATHRLRADSPLRLMALIILSLAVVVAGYTLIEHTFDLFLYPDRAMRDGLYVAASIPLGMFDVLIGMLTVAIVTGWVATYYAHAQPDAGARRVARVKLIFYSLISREFYIADVYAKLGGMVLGLSKRLNVWLRWV